MRIDYRSSSRRFWLRLYPKSGYLKRSTEASQPSLSVRAANAGKATVSRGTVSASGTMRPAVVSALALSMPSVRICLVLSAMDLEERLFWRS